MSERRGRDKVYLDAKAEAVLRRIAESGVAERVAVVRDADGTVIDVISVADLDRG